MLVYEPVLSLEYFSVYMRMPTPFFSSLPTLKMPSSEILGTLFENNDTTVCADLKPSEALMCFVLLNKHSLDRSFLYAALHCKAATG